VVVGPPLFMLVVLELLGKVMAAGRGKAQVIRVLAAAVALVQ